MSTRMQRANTFGERVEAFLPLIQQNISSNLNEILLYSLRSYVVQTQVALDYFKSGTITVLMNSEKYLSTVDKKYSKEEALEDYQAEVSEFIRHFRNNSRVNFVKDEQDLIERKYEAIIQNPPYSTYKNAEGKKIVNPSQLFVERAAEYLSDDGVMAVLCRAMDLGRNTKAGARTRNSLEFESVHYSSTNFGFNEIGSAVCGIIGLSRRSKLKPQLKVYYDSNIISRKESQFSLPTIYEPKQQIEIELSLKCFKEEYTKKWGTGNELRISYIKLTSRKTDANYFDGTKLSTKGLNNKQFSLPGESSEKDLLEKFLSTKLLQCLSNIQCQGLIFGGGVTNKHLLGCIPDCWRELDTDEKLYQHFNLTQEEIDFVENYKPKSYK